MYVFRIITVCMFDLQGLCNYLMSSVPGAKAMGIVVGYDGRYNSER